MLHDARLANLLLMKRSAGSAPDVLLALAVAYDARSMAREAKDSCDELLEMEPDHPEAWYETVVAHSFGGPDEVERLRPRVEGVLARNPEAAWAHRNLGLLLYYLERDEEARAACARALELDPRDSHAHEVLAYLHYTVGDLDQAVEEGIQAVELEPSNFRALHWLGWCYLKLGATEQAVRYFHRCLRMEDSYFLALESLGAVYLRDESTFPEAVQCFSKMLSVNPRYFPVYFRLADALIQADRLTEAAAQAEAVLHLSPDPTTEAEAHQYLGLIGLMDDALPAARAHFERALEIDPGLAAAHHYLGVLHEQEDRLAEAESCFRRAIDCDPGYALPRIRLGYLCFDRKEYENARRHFEEALAIDEEDYLAHLGLGELARWRRDYAAQLEHCRRAAELAPDDGNVRNQLGTAHDALGDPEAAIREYELALNLNPYNRQAANNLGYLYERLLQRADEDQDESAGLRSKAIHAWRRRLLICRDTRSSTRGARNHLRKLGVDDDEIERWLEEGQVA